MGSARCLSPSRPAWAWCPSREEAWEAPAHRQTGCGGLGRGVGWTCLTASVCSGRWLGDSVHVLLSCHRLYWLSGRQGKCPGSFLVLGSTGPKPLFSHP